MPEATAEFTSELERLPELRRRLRELCRLAWNVGDDEPILDQVELAFHEAAANVIRHAYHGQAALPIQMEACANADGLVLRLLHDGAPFQDAEQPAPVLDGSRKGGLGLFFLRQLVDAIEYFENERGKNGVEIMKRFIRNEQEC